MLLRPFPTIPTTLLLVFLKIIFPIIFSILSCRAKYCSFLSILLLHPGVWGFFASVWVLRWLDVFNKRQMETLKSKFVPANIHTEIGQILKGQGEKKPQFSCIMNSCKNPKKLFLTIGWTIINTTRSKQHARSSHTQRMENEEE